MWYIVRVDSSRVATLVKVRSATLVSSSDPTRVKSNYIPVETTILRQIERCQGVSVVPQLPNGARLNWCCTNSKGVGTCQLGVLSLSVIIRNARIALNVITFYLGFGVNQVGAFAPTDN